MSSSHIHVLGVCGTFMGGLAQLARSLGYGVSGSDQNVYPPMSDQLAGAGIELMRGYKPEHLERCNHGKGPDIVVIGNALSRGNPAVEAVLNRGYAYTSGPQWLAEHVLSGRWVLAVAGTHGKTTTTGILAWLLEAAGLKPGFLVGGVPGNFGVSARLGESPFFVVEADEYDTAFFDKRSKFVHYRPRTLILNNLEFDHADIFPDLAAIRRQFHHLLRTVPGDGRIIANASDANLAEVLETGCWTPVERFAVNGSPGADWRVRERGATGRFELTAPDGSPVEGMWSLPGAHNLSNALAAVAAARHAGVRPVDAVTALHGFAGIKRRLEVLGTAGGVTLYDDFAHHPTAIRATLAALRGRAGRGRVLAVVEPRSNTMRMGVHNDALPGSLKAADHAWLYRGENAAPGLERLAGARLEICDTLDDIIAGVVSRVCEGDHLVLMSNGGFGGLHAKLLDALLNR